MGTPSSTLFKCSDSLSHSVKAEKFPFDIVEQVLNICPLFCVSEQVQIDHVEAFPLLTSYLNSPAELGLFDGNPVIGCPLHFEEDTPRLGLCNFFILFLVEINSCNRVRSFSLSFCFMQIASRTSRLTFLPPRAYMELQVWMS